MLIRPIGLATNLRNSDTLGARSASATDTPAAVGSASPVGIRQCAVFWRRVLWL